jgi:hypothetical protein
MAAAVSLCADVPAGGEDIDRFLLPGIDVGAAHLDRRGRWGEGRRLLDRVEGRAMQRGVAHQLGLRDRRPESLTGVEFVAEQAQMCLAELEGDQHDHFVVT